MKKVAVFLLILTGVSSASAQQTVIRASLLLDGKGGERKDVDIVVEGEKIVRLAKPSGKAAYDLTGLTITPGWIDTHAHIGSHFNKEGRFAGMGSNKSETAEESTLLVAANAYATLMGGFTTIQSPGQAEDKPLRDDINAGRLPGPRILTSLTPLTLNSGTPDQLRAKVRQLKADGADLVKLFATKSIRDGGAQTMSDAQITAVCSEAKAIGMRAIVHAHSSHAAIVAAQTGCTSIEHGALLDDAALQVFADRGVYFDPNFAVLQNYFDNKAKYLGIGNYTEEGFAYMKKAQPMTADVLRRAIAKHVKVVLGTDAMAGLAGNNSNEFVFRVRAGQKPMDAIVSGTSLAAESLGLQKQIGTIAPGMDADLVAVAGNPLTDITSVHQVRFVMKSGKVFKNVTK
jgi:imidazolonepropionase-like amidohydrolase